MRQLVAVALLIVGVDLLIVGVGDHLWDWKSYLGAALLGAFVSVIWNREAKS